MTALAPTLQAFFTDRVLAQRGASPHTIGAYRTTFRLLLGYTSDKLHKPPSGLDFGELDAPLVAASLAHIETARHNSVRTRNNRLAAIHSLFTYAALRHPEHAASIQRVLSIGPKRFDSNLVTFLSEAEVNALLNACNRDTWTGRRDHTMILLAIQTGLRISELTELTCADVSLGPGANIHCIGKGRKERRTPLVPSTVHVPADPLFPTSTGNKLSRDAIEHRASTPRSVVRTRALRAFRSAVRRVSSPLRPVSNTRSAARSPSARGTARRSACRCRTCRAASNASIGSDLPTPARASVAVVSLPRRECLPASGRGSARPRRRK